MAERLGGSLPVGTLPVTARFPMFPDGARPVRRSGAPPEIIVLAHDETDSINPIPCNLRSNAGPRQPIGNHDARHGHRRPTREPPVRRFRRLEWWSTLTGQPGCDDPIHWKRCQFATSAGGLGWRATRSHHPSGQGDCPGPRIRPCATRDLGARGLCGEDLDIDAGAALAPVGALECRAPRPGQHATDPPTSDDVPRPYCAASHSTEHNPLDHNGNRCRIACNRTAGPGTRHLWQDATFILGRVLHFRPR